MREIKFRGKRLYNGEWVYGNLVTMDTYGHGYTGTGIQVKNSKTAIYSVQVDPATVGQWTGLTDNHGKEIFEGDIFKTITSVVAVVEWEPDGRFLGSTVDREKKIVYIGREPKVELIGNIWEENK